MYLQVSAYLRARTLSAQNLCETCLSRAARLRSLNALTTITAELARSQATESDQRQTNGLMADILHKLCLFVPVGTCVAEYKKRNCSECRNIIVSNNLRSLVTLF